MIPKRLSSAHRSLTAKQNASHPHRKREGARRAWDISGQGCRSAARSLVADIQMVGVHAPQKHPSLVNLNEGILTSGAALTVQIHSCQK